MQRSTQVITESAGPHFAAKRVAAWLYAAAAAAAVLGWQAATVHFNYSDNWTALFMTGETHPAPPELAAGTYRFPGSPGYDGQFYRYVAHAPWVRTDWAGYYDSPRMRQERILVPAMAWLAAAGQGPFVDAAYIVVVLFWVLLGVHWLGRYAVLEQHHPAWGLSFLLLPATLTSIDRMTVDVALAALCVAFVLYAKEQSGTRLYVVLLLAPLVRETGALLLAAQCAHEAASRRWRRAAGFATAILPAAAWYLYVWRRLPPAAVTHPEKLLPHWLFRYPAIGILMKLFQPVHYPFGPWLNLSLQCADTLALCACLALMAAGGWELLRRPWDVEQWAILAFIGLALATSAPGFWGNVYAYARPFSALIFLAALRPLRRGAGWVLAPVMLIALRVGLQMAPQAAGIARGLWHAL
ncbi:MAG TPA: hypothetical protein VMI94_12085 [Bryobacteraceae bacterium]|nr:hypothetical protein [Bryobacteraceae bacterium]